MKAITKEQYITAFKKELKAQTGCLQPIDIDHITMSSIWHRPKDESQRLTHFGFTILDDLIGLESWSFEIDITNNVLLNLDRYIDCPYYISRSSTPTATIFNAKLATAIAIQGSIEKFIKTRSIRHESTKL